MASTYVLERRRKLVDLAARSAVLEYINMEDLQTVVSLDMTYSSVSIEGDLDVSWYPAARKSATSFGYLLTWCGISTPRDSRLEAGLVEAPK